MAKINTLIDNFDDNSLDEIKWNLDLDGGGTIVESGQKIIISPTASDASYEAIWGISTYDLTSSAVFLQVLQKTNGACPIWLTVAKSDFTGAIRIGIYSNRLYIGTWEGDIDSIELPSTSIWLKISESGGYIYFWYSLDGTSWTQVGSALANPFVMTSVFPAFSAENYGAESSPGAAWFDNFNIVQGSASPSISPSKSPSQSPSVSPSVSPSPSASPSRSSSASPSISPSSSVSVGSSSPSISPSRSPSISASVSPSPSASPSKSPSKSPSVSPSPSASPSRSPSVSPSPSMSPSSSPSISPSVSPSYSLPSQGYYLNEIKLKNPKTFSREFIYQKTDMTSLNGKTFRDMSSRKIKYYLSFENLTKIQVDALQAIVALNVPVHLYIFKKDLINISTTVIPYIGSIIHETVGSDYLANVQIEMIEEESST
jgi:hypothetical protein